MAKVIDMVGKRYSKLVGLKRMGSNKNWRAMWLFQCDCGNTTIARGVYVRNGHTRSCGCIREVHGMAKRNAPKNRLYEIWRDMKERCRSPNNKNYGKRGIKVCEEWKDFRLFQKDMLEAYKQHVKRYGEKQTQIDRINNDGNYTPDNCRWVTRIEQANNMRNNRFLEYGGKRKTVTQWAREKKICPETLFARLRYGWSVSKTLNSPVAGGVSFSR